MLKGLGLGYYMRSTCMDKAVSSGEPQGKRPLITHSLNKLRSEHCLVQPKGVSSYTSIGLGQRGAAMSRKGLLPFSNFLCLVNNIGFCNIYYDCKFYIWLRYSSQISDDDRMSLTTAVSDEEDGESVMASPYKAKTTGTAAASFNCTGAVRKAG